HSGVLGIGQHIQEKRRDTSTAASNVQKTLHVVQSGKQLLQVRFHCSMLFRRSTLPDNAGTMLSPIGRWIVFEVSHYQPLGGVKVCSSVEHSAHTGRMLPRALTVILSACSPQY